MCSRERDRQRERDWGGRERESEKEGEAGAGEGGRFAGEVDRNGTAQQAFDDETRDPLKHCDMTGAGSVRHLERLRKDSQAAGGCRRCYCCSFVAWSLAACLS